MGKLVHDINLKGKRFGNLTAIENVGRKQRSGRNIVYWNCRCDCGKTKEIAREDLLSGRVKSCGCYALSIRTKHGGYKERLYHVWQDMRNRCNSPSDARYSNYGGRGISICDEWNDYSAFKKWAMNNGYDPDAAIFECTIDRTDNNGNYEPSNCRFVSMQIQANNTRKNVNIEMDGTIKTLKQWCEYLNSDYKKATHRKDANKEVREWFDCDLPYDVVKVI